MVAYVPIIVSFLVGMGVFGLMRQRDNDPIVSGVAATFLSMAVAVALFVVVLRTGNL